MSSKKKAKVIHSLPGKARGRAAANPNSIGEPATNQDAKRRLGNFGGAGEHPRQGGRATGIVGQTKQRFKTNKKR